MPKCLAHDQREKVCFDGAQDGNGDVENKRKPPPLGIKHYVLDCGKTGAALAVNVISGIQIATI